MAETVYKPVATAAAEEGVKDLRARMLGKKFWVVTTKPCAPPEEVGKHLREHLQNQIRLEKEGIMFAAGPIRDPQGNFEYGMFILRCNSEAEARAIADNDPMHKAGVRKYELHTWTMNEGRINVSINASDGSYTLA
jgi:hypothetical protein